MNNLLEELAELEHKQWSHWVMYMLKNLTEENINRWKRQLGFTYSELSEKEKESGREWARKAIEIMMRPAGKLEVKKVDKI